MLLKTANKTLHRQWEKGILKDKIKYRGYQFVIGIVTAPRITEIRIYWGPL